MTDMTDPTEPPYIPIAQRMSPEARALADATWRALNEPGGDDILDAMASGEISILDGLVELAVRSGDYERFDPS